MNIFEALRADHDVQRRLLGLLIETQGDSDGRDELFKRLRAALQDHAAAEERHFYVPLMQIDSAQDQARHGVAEHHEIDELIAALEDTDRSSPGWIASARKLHDKVSHHLQDEEHGIFQLSGRVLDDDQKLTLGREYRQMMDELGA